MDGASPGVTADFPPTVASQTTRSRRSHREVTVSAAVSIASRRSARLLVTRSTARCSRRWPWRFAGIYQATIPAQPDGTRVDSQVAATAGGQTTTFVSGYFSGTTPVSLRTIKRTASRSSRYAARIQERSPPAAIRSAPARTTTTSGRHRRHERFPLDRDADAVFPDDAGLSRRSVGRIGFNGGRLRLDLTESLEKTRRPTASPSGRRVRRPAGQTTIGALKPTLESFEGQFVSIATFNHQRHASGDAAAVRYVRDHRRRHRRAFDEDRDDTDIEGFNPGSTFTAVGIVQQDDFLRPFDTGYNVTPRSRADLGGAAAADADHHRRRAHRRDQQRRRQRRIDFVPDLLDQVVKIRGAVTSIDFRGGNGIEYYIQDATGGVDLFSTR